MDFQVEVKVVHSTVDSKEMTVYGEKALLRRLSTLPKEASEIQGRRGTENTTILF